MSLLSLDKSVAGEKASTESRQIATEHWSRRLNARRHVILCCDCEGTKDELARLAVAIDNAGVAANFFFVGETARSFPALVADIATRHQTESHTMTHPNLRRLGREAQRREILDGKAAVEDTIGRATRGFRAPYHCYNKDTVAILNEEGFAFDASGLYFRYNMGRVAELTPTWFREWMPLYGRLGLSPHRVFGIFRTLVRARRLCLLPAHPQYAGMSKEMAQGFESFLKWAAEEQGAVFWPIDFWLHATRRLELPPGVTAAPVESLT